MSTVSLIIITRDVGQRFALCIAAASAHRPAAGEIIFVVDEPHALDDAQANIASMPVPSQVVRGRGQGRAAARNDGAQAAGGDVLLFLDGDMVTTPDLIAQYRRLLALSDGFVRGRVRELLGAAICHDFIAGAPGFPRIDLADLRASGFSPDGYRMASNLLEQGVEARFIGGDEAIPAWLASAGANFMVLRSVWTALGGQNERFGRRWGCEDLEFSYRVAERLGSVTFAPDAVGYHLSHPQPDRWSDHRQTLDLFFELHPDRSVRALDHLLARDGTLERYRAALTGMPP